MTEQRTTHPEMHPAEKPEQPRILPFSFESGFGGVDATKHIYSQKAIRLRLFDFSGGPFKRATVRWPSAPGVAEQFASADFDVPDVLDFAWTTDNRTETRAGSTMASFQRDLTQSLSGSASAFGFGAELSVTFGETDFEETYQKYVARYERQQVYSVGFEPHADPRDWLSSRARDDLAHAPAKDIVDFYGTHYMASAVFGGLKVHWAKLDIRDEIKSEDLKTAMSLTFDSDDGSGSVGTSTETETVRKLRQKMKVTTSRTRGGKRNEKNEELWLQSLFTDPAVIGYELKPISDLAPEARRKEIDDEVAGRLKKGAVKATAEMLAMRVPIWHQGSDHMSGAKKSLSVARPAYRYGWFYIGQWGLSQGGSFPAGYESLIFSNLPGTKERPALKPATGMEQLWDTDKASGMGLYRALPIDGYTGVGHLWEDTRDLSHLGNVDFYGLVRDDLLKPSQWLHLEDAFWDDHGTGRSKGASVYTFAAGETPDPPGEQTLWVPATGAQAYMFRAFKGYGTDGEPLQVNMSKVRILANAWLD